MNQSRIPGRHTTRVGVIKYKEKRIRFFDLNVINRLAVRENNRQVGNATIVDNYPGWSALEKIARRNASYALEAALKEFKNEEEERKRNEQETKLAGEDFERFLKRFDLFVTAAAPLLEWVPIAGTFLAGAKQLYQLVREQFPVT